MQLGMERGRGKLRGSRMERMAGCDWNFDFRDLQRFHHSFLHQSTTEDKGHPSPKVATTAAIHLASALHHLDTLKCSP